MDATLILFVGTAFVAVVGIVFAAGQFVLDGSRLRRRLPVGEGQSAEQVQPSRGRIAAVLPARFTEDRFGIDDRLRQKLRLKLVRSGYLGPNAIRHYILARLTSVVAFPCAALAVYATYRPNFSIFGVALLVSIAAGAGIFGPDAYLSYRQSKQIKEYRLNFPDLLDLLTVCVTAGLTVEKSFETI